MLDRLMGRTVLAQADGIVGVHQQYALMHQRRHAHGVARVVGKGQERAAIGNQRAVQRQAIHGRRHAKLPHAVIHIVAGRVGRLDGARDFLQRVVRAAQVGRATQQFGQFGADHIQRRLGGHTRRLCAGDGLRRTQRGLAGLAPVGRQPGAHAPLELRGELRKGAAIAAVELLPDVLGRASGLLVIPGCFELCGHLEWRSSPAKSLLGRRDLLGTQCLAMGGLGAGLGRGAEANHGLAADHRRPLQFALGLASGLRDRLAVLTIHALHMPAIGLEALGRVIGEPALNLAVDRNAVVVVEHDELAELECAGQRAGFVRNAFHEAPIAAKYPGVMVDDRQFGPVEVRRENLFGQRHADAVGEPLSERPGRGLDAHGDVVLGMAGRAATELAEIAQLIHGDRIAGQMQQRIQQH